MDRIVLGLTRSIERALARFHRGSSLPGKLLLEYNPSMLKKLSDKYRVILVTGTNGKTTSASLLARILADAGHPVIHNATGANLLPGIMTLFIKHEADRDKEFAVVEIDEATLPLYTRTASVEYILGTNLFRDQLDRYGEVYSTLRKIENGIREQPDATVVLNGDEPLFGTIKGKTVYYGFEEKPSYTAIEQQANIEGQYCLVCREKYTYEFRTYSHLGKYQCKKCGYKRPSLKYYAKGIRIEADNGLMFKINDRLPVKAALGGVYNVYNIIGAFTVAREIGVPEDVIVRSIQMFRPRFGRSELFEYGGKTLKIALIKNPVSLNQELRLPFFNDRNKCVCFLLNDLDADGRDVSWIWDVDFENNFKEYRRVFVSGLRKYDMAVRLETAGYATDRMTISKDPQSLIDELIACDECDYYYIFATYTAMLEFRRLLAKKGIVEHAW